MRRRRTPPAIGSVLVFPTARPRPFADERGLLEAADEALQTSPIKALAFVNAALERLTPAAERGADPTEAGELLAQAYSIAIEVLVKRGKQDDAARCFGKLSLQSFWVDPWRSRALEAMRAGLAAKIAAG